MVSGVKVLIADRSKIKQMMATEEIMHEGITKAVAEAPSMATEAMADA